MKIKQIEIDGETFSIAALNVAQVEDYLEEIPETDEKKKQQAYKCRAYNVVCCGLNNARPSDAAAWTKDRVRTELSWPAYMRLQKEVLELSGMVILSRTEAGEAPAPVSPVIQ